MTQECVKYQVTNAAKSRDMFPPQHESSASASKDYSYVLCDANARFANVFVIEVGTRPLIASVVHANMCVIFCLHSLATFHFSKNRVDKRLTVWGCVFCIC